MRLSAPSRLRYGMRTLTVLLSGCLLAAFSLGAVPRAHADSAEEYRLKAAFLYNFASFTDWPETLGDTLAFCVYGEDPFGAHLDALAGTAIGSRRIAVHRARSVEALPRCDLVYVSPAMVGNLPRLFDVLGRNATLVVTDAPGSLQHGAMLNMNTAAGRVTFSANLAATRRQGLNLSAKLLRLATEVVQ